MRYIFIPRRFLQFTEKQSVNALSMHNTGISFSYAQSEQDVVVNRNDLYLGAKKMSHGKKNAVTMTIDIRSSNL